MNSKKTTLIFAASVILMVAIYLVFQKSKSMTPEANYKPVVGQMTLTETQKEDLPKKNGNGISIYRTLDHEQIFQTVIGAEPHAENDLVIGELDTKSSTEVNVPVYLCSFQINQKKNFSLDPSETCSSEGHLERPNPVGYLSKDIRVGFRMLVRCRSQKSGFYLSLNPRCENPDDRMDSLLGSIRSKVI